MKRVRFTNPVQPEDKIEIDVLANAKLYMSTQQSSAGVILPTQPSWAIPRTRQRSWKFKDGEVLLKEDIHNHRTTVTNNSNGSFLLTVGNFVGTVHIRSNWSHYFSESYEHIEACVEDCLRQGYSAGNQSQCTHEWETRMLFTSSYEACRLCKQEKK